MFGRNSPSGPRSLNALAKQLAAPFTVQAGGFAIVTGLSLEILNPGNRALLVRGVLAGLVSATGGTPEWYVQAEEFDEDGNSLGTSTVSNTQQRGPTTTSSLQVSLPAQGIYTRQSALAVRTVLSAYATAGGAATWILRAAGSGGLIGCACLSAELSEVAP